MIKLLGEGENQLVVMSMRDFIPRFEAQWDRGEDVPLDVDKVFQDARLECIRAQEAEQSQERSGGMSM